MPGRVFDLDKAILPKPVFDFCGKVIAESRTHVFLALREVIV